MLYGREAECAQLSALLEAARGSRSAALVLRGEPGAGKTALLEEARARASGMHVLAARGVESEAELPFGGLHQLIRPALPLLDHLPEPQAAALRGAFGLAVRAGEDRFMIAVAGLTLLSELAEQRPVLCLIDDAQWLDASSAGALLFVARRLDAEGIVMLFAVRDGEEHRLDAHGVPELVVGSLDKEAASALIAGRSGAVATTVQRLLVEQSGGNALALVELPNALSTAQLAGGEPLPRNLPLTPNVERLFLQQVRRLPEQAQKLLSLVAAEESGSLAPVMRASEAAGIDGDALRAAERSGLVSVRGTRIDMRHPLVRSAIFQGLSSDERRAAHLALANVLDDDDSFDERTWHLAAATVGPDAGLADALETVAERARSRSAHAPAAAALERAAELTSDSEWQGRRLAAAAADAWHAGQPGRASALLDRADGLVTDRRLRADVVHLRGEVQLRCGGLLEACDILTAGAADVAPLDARKALEMLIKAREAAGWAGDTPRSAETGHRAAALPASADPTTQFLSDLLVGIGKLYEGETAVAMPLVRGVVARANDFDEPSWVTWTATGAQGLGDEQRAAELHQRAIGLARRSGAVDKLTYALLTYVLMGLFAGRLGVAAEAAEGLTLAREAGLPNAESKHLAMLSWFAAVRGDEDECRASAETALELARASGGAFANALAEWGLGLLELSRRRAEQAATHLEAVRDPTPGIGHPYFALLSAPDLVEAFVLAGRVDRAVEAFTPFDAFAQTGAPMWVLALGARCRALLADDPEPLFAEALRQHADSARPLDRARTLLLLGEHRRRRGEHAESREPLRAALDGFEELGAEGWAQRAREELRAGGETAGARDPSLLAGLAPEELQMARLVADGHSNREVAARLFRSPKTIDVQLRRVFAKLGVFSRIELASLGLASEPAGAALRSRLARAGLTELFRDLRTMTGAGLQEALARTVGDPELVVAQRRADDGYPDAAGEPVVLPPEGGPRAVARVEVAGRAVAAVVYDAALDDDAELVEALCAAVGIVIDNERLHAESETRLAELQASRRRIVAAGDTERRRLERNLHDGAQQRLVALALQLRLLQSHIRRDPAAAEALVTSATDQLAQSLSELRELARGIHPAALEHGLPSALESLAARSTVPTAVTCEVTDHLPQPIELALYFVACEALANVGKYAGATAASVRAWPTETGVAIEIADDGVGGADEAAGSGLRGLTDRVEALDGLLLVTSPPGAGTVITAELPCSARRFPV